MRQDINILFDKELEASVLGAIMREKSAIARVAALLRPEMFYLGQNEVIANAVFRLYRKNAAIDLTTVFIEIKQAGDEKKVAVQDVMALTNAVISTAHLEEHVAKLAELYMSREVQRLAGGAYTKAGEWSNDIFDSIQDLQRGLADLLAGTMQGGLVGVDRIITETLKYIDSQTPDKITGVPTGITGLDQLFYGWKPAELIIMAARPGCGKTAFARQVARYASGVAGLKGGFFSLEMSRHQLLQRDLSALSGVYFSRIQRNKMEEHERHLLNEAAVTLAGMPMYIDDTFSANAQVIHSKSTQVKFRSGLDYIMVDYLQLIGGKIRSNQNREQIIAENSRALKGLAKDLNIPVIALSQMSRDIEKGGRREPQLSDLRESGAIEQDADVVMFLSPEEQEAHEFGKPRIVKAKIAKHRSGALHTIPLLFDGNYMRFTEYRKEYQPAIQSGNFRPVNYSEPAHEQDGPF